jgi:thiamine-monophosphate kinase
LNLPELLKEQKTSFNPPKRDQQKGTLSGVPSFCGIRPLAAVNQPRSPLKVEDLKEQGLLARLQKFCPTDIVGDDAALLAVEPHQSLVVTTDVLVDQVHFSDRTTTPGDAGWRAVAANLSDLAAMGATPIGLTVGLSLPGQTSVDWLEQVYQGMADCAQQFGAAIVGGDITRSTVLTIAIAAFGQVPPKRAIRRSSARPGDAILVTGVHGASRAGLELLLHPTKGDRLEQSDRAFLIQSHQRPKPRFDVISRLWQIVDETNSTAQIAGMDSSDGLADAVVQLCRASKVGAQLERSQIPLPSALTSWVSVEQALNWALYGGEDFELVLCLPATIAHRLVQQLGAGAAVIGTIVSGDEVILHDSTGTYPDEVLTLEQGFQHF